MSENAEYNYYSVSADSERISIKLKPFYWKSWLLLLPLELPIILAAFYSSTIVFKSGSGYGWGVLFLVIGAALSLGLTIDAIYSQKREKVFSFLIDGEGIKHIDGDGIYILHWDEICCFGYVSLIRAGPTWRSCLGRHEKCLYFARTVHDKKYMKRHLQYRETHSLYCHTSSDNIIAFYYDNREFPDKLDAQIRALIKKYKPNIQEISYTDSNP